MHQRKRSSRFMVKNKKTNTFQAAYIVCYALPWDTMRHKIRYVAYLKEKEKGTNEDYYRVFAYAKTSLRGPGWRKLFQAPSDEPFHIGKIHGYFEQFAAYKTLLEQGRLRELGQRPSLRARPNLQAAKVQNEAQK